jgi:hypothetical protein
MVVDIQGVGDLYTDPQIHTASGVDYGDGNLGVKGFALFFSSHVCNDVCRQLGLSEFDLAPSELTRHTKLITSMQRSLSTQTRSSEELAGCGSPPISAHTMDLFHRNRIRYRSDNSMCSDDCNSIVEIEESEGYESSTSPSPLPQPSVMINSHHGGGGGSGHNHHGLHHVSFSMPIGQQQNAYSSPIPISSPMAMFQQQQQLVLSRTPRMRNESSCLDSGFSVDEAVNYFKNIENKNLFKARPSSVSGEKELLASAESTSGNKCNDTFCEHEEDAHHDHDEDDDEDDDSDEDEVYSPIFADEDESILGKVHLELCKYHELGRFRDDDSEACDEEAAFFHLKQAAYLGIKEALINIAKIYLQLPHEILPSYQVEVGGCGEKNGGKGPFITYNRKNKS